VLLFIKREEEEEEEEDFAETARFFARKLISFWRFEPAKVRPKPN